MARSDSGPLANAQQPAVVEASIKDRLGQQRLSLTYDKTKQAFALRDERAHPTEHLGVHHPIDQQGWHRENRPGRDTNGRDLC